MKLLFFKSMSLVTLLCCAQNVLAQNVGIGTATPNASALLEINSNSKGLLIPKMTAAQKNAIVLPSNGLMVFQTDSAGGLYYNSGVQTAPVWERMVTSSSAWSLQGNGGTVPGTHFIGTTDAQGLRFKIHNVHAGLIDSNRFFVGYKSGNTTTTTLNNMAVGDSSLSNATSGDFNLAIGKKTLFNNRTGSNNTAVGFSGLLANTTGSDNVAIGYEALLFNIESGNTAIGSKALFKNTTGMYNVATGLNSLITNTTGSYNTATGMSSMYSNSTGEGNTAIGSESLAFNTTGNHNTATGFHSLYLNSSGIRNTASGYQSLYVNTTGNYNTATGFNSLLSNTTGSRNTAAGYQSLNSNTSGGDNTSMGYGSLYSNSTGNNNIALGNISLLNNSTGNFNVAVGSEALKINTKGQKLLALGYKADAGNDSLVNATAIGANSKVNCSNCLVLGSVKNINGADEDVNVGIGQTNPQAPLQFATDLRNRKIVLWSNQNNEHHFNGFGINAFVLRYQVNTINDSHVFYAGTTDSTSAELMRIQGNGNVGIGTDTPSEKLDVTGNARITGSLTVNDIAQDAVQNISLLNSWVDYGFGFAGSGYYKDREGRVHVSGLIKSGNTTSGTLLFQLPAGLRPPGRLMFNVENNGVIGRIDILANGEVLLMAATNNAFLNLTGISFRAN